MDGAFIPELLAASAGGGCEQQGQSCPIGVCLGQGSAELLPLPGLREPPRHQHFPPPRGRAFCPGSLPQGRGTQVLWFSASVHARAAPAPLLECMAGLSPARPGLRAEMPLVVQGPAVRGNSAPAPPSSCCLYQLFPPHGGRPAPSPASARCGPYRAPCLLLPPAGAALVRDALPPLLLWLLGRGAACSPRSAPAGSQPPPWVWGQLLLTSPPRRPRSPCACVGPGLGGACPQHCCVPPLRSVACCLPPCCRGCVGAGGAPWRAGLAGVAPAPSAPSPPPLPLDCCYVCWGGFFVWFGFVLFVVVGFFFFK